MFGKILQKYKKVNDALDEEEKQQSPQSNQLLQMTQPIVALEHQPRRTLKEITFGNRRSHLHKSSLLDDKPKPSDYKLIGNGVRLIPFRNNLKSSHSRYFDYDPKDYTLTFTSDFTEDHFNYSSRDALPESGKYCFMVRASQVSFTMIGVCAAHVVDSSNIYKSPLCLCIDLWNGTLHHDGMRDEIEPKFQNRLQGQVFKVQVDMDQKLVHWSEGKRLFCACKMNELMVKYPIHAFVAMWTPGQQVILIDSTFELK